MASKYKGKQRKAHYNAPHHRRQKKMGVHLSEDLRTKHGKRSIPVVKGDTVAIMRGDDDIKGHVGKVDLVDRKHYRISIDGVTMAKADGTEVARKISPSNVVITRLNLDDPRRKTRISTEEEE